MPDSTRWPRRVLLTTIAAALVVLLGSAAAVHLRAEHAWRVMATEARALQHELLAARTDRAPLWGTAAPGAAFDHYDHAASLARTLLRADQAAMLAALRATDAQLAGDGGELRARWAPVVAALRAGAHAADAKPRHGPDVDGDTAGVVVSLLDCRWVANAAVFEARALRHAGRDVDAVQHTLDVAALGADLLRNGVLVNAMIGAAIVTIATDAWPDDALAALDHGALDELAAGLERLDRMLPERVVMTAELVFFAQNVRAALEPPRGAAGAAATDTSWFPGALASWRWGGSTRWMVADAFLQWSEHVRTLARIGPAWPLRRAALELESREAAASTNPLLAAIVPSVVAAESSHRLMLARLRVLRMAVDLHRGLDVPPLRDPLGDGPIHVRRGDVVELRCGDAADPAAATRSVRRRR